MRGESKDGLSTYYMKFRHEKNVFDHMHDRIVQMDLNGSSYIKIIGIRNSLEKEWHNHYEFLTWEYGKHHLKQSDMDRLHCFTLVLGDNFEQSKKENFCIKCLTCFSFFKGKFFPFLKRSMNKYLQITRMKLQP